MGMDRGLGEGQVGDGGNCFGRKRGRSNLGTGSRDSGGASQRRFCGRIKSACLLVGKAGWRASEGGQQSGALGRAGRLCVAGQ